MKISDVFNHLSPSAGNDFIERRGMGFFAGRILKLRAPMGAKPHAGTAMETGIVHAIKGELNEDAAIDHALSQYDEITIDVPDEEAETERRTIAPAIKAGVAELRELISAHGPIVATQKKVTGKLNPYGLDWVGYLDVQLESGLIIDFKKSARMPSVIPGGHARQGAFYAHCEDAPMAFLYVVVGKNDTRSKVAELLPENISGRIAELAAAERAITAMLANVDRPSDLAPFCFPDPDHYTLSTPEARQIATEIWGIAA